MSDTVVSAATTSRSPFSVTLATSLGRGAPSARRRPASSRRASDRIVGGPATDQRPHRVELAGRTPLVAHRVTLIPGDGIGPEVIEAARRVVEATGVSIEWERRDMGAGAFSRTGRALPLETLDSIRANRVSLKGPIETPVTSGLRSSNLELRKSLDLYANVRPCKLYPGVPSVYEAVDLVIVRENTEGMYTGLEFQMGTVAVKELIGFVEDSTGRHIREDSGVSIKSISERGSERVVRFAFEEARRRGRTRVTASHKANIMKFSDGLFLEVARR